MQQVYFVSHFPQYSILKVHPCFVIRLKSAPFYEYISTMFPLHSHADGHLRFCKFRASMKTFCEHFCIGFLWTYVFISLVIYLEAEFLGNRTDTYLIFKKLTMNFPK